MKKLFFCFFLLFFSINVLALTFDEAKSNGWYTDDSLNSRETDLFIFSNSSQARCSPDNECEIEILLINSSVQTKFIYLDSLFLNELIALNIWFEELTEMNVDVEKLEETVCGSISTQEIQDVNGYSYYYICDDSGAVIDGNVLASYMKKVVKQEKQWIWSKLNEGDLESDPSQSFNTHLFDSNKFKAKKRLNKYKLQGINAGGSLNNFKKLKIHFSVPENSGGEFLFTSDIADSFLDPFWDTDWSCKIRVDLNSGAGVGNHVNVPIRMNINPSNFWSESGCGFQADGDDFRAVNYDETQALPYYFEGNWTSTDANILIGLDDYNGGLTDYFWIYGKNDNAVNAEDSNSVYDANYSFVWQLDDAGSPVVSKASGGKHGWQSGGTITYQVGEGLKLGLGVTVNAASEYFDTNINFGGQASGTFILTTVPAGNGYILGGDDSVNNRFYFVRNLDGSLSMQSKRSGIWVWDYSTAVNDSLLAYQDIAFTWGASGQKTFVNGRLVGSSTDTGALPNPSTDFFIFDCNPSAGCSGNNIFDGTHDQVLWMTSQYDQNFISLMWSSNNNALITGYSNEFSSLNAVPDININAPVSGNYWSGVQTIDFNIADSDYNSLLDYNLSIYLDSDTSAPADSGIVDDWNFNNSVNCDVDGNLAVSRNCTYSWDTTSAADGNWFIQIDFNDSTDINTSYSSSFVVDNTNPNTIALDFNNYSDSWSKADQNIVLSCSDAASGCNSTNYRIDSGSWTVFDANVLFASDGNFAFDFNSTDRAGNVEDVNTLYVLVDKTAPVLSGLTPTGYLEQASTTFTFTADLSDALSGANKCFYERFKNNASDLNGSVLVSSGTCSLTFIDGAGVIDTNYFIKWIGNDAADNNSASSSSNYIKLVSAASITGSSQELGGGGDGGGTSSVVTVIGGKLLEVTPNQNIINYAPRVLKKYYLDVKNITNANVAVNVSLPDDFKPFLKQLTVTPLTVKPGESFRIDFDLISDANLSEDLSSEIKVTGNINQDIVLIPLTITPRGGGLSLFDAQLFGLPIIVIGVIAIIAFAVLGR